MRTDLPVVFICVLLILTFNLVLTDSSPYNNSSVQKTSSHDIYKRETYNQLLIDPNLEDDSAWNFSSVRHLYFDTYMPNDPKGSWEYDPADYVKGSRSIKLTLTDDNSTWHYGTIVRATTSFTYDYDWFPLRVLFSWQMKTRFTGTISSDSVVAYARFHDPNSEWPEYATRTEVASPFLEEWTTVTQNISLLAYAYVLEKATKVTFEFGVEWSNPGRNPDNDFPDPVETGTAEFWFDEIQVLVAQPTMTNTPDTYPKIDWFQTYGGPGDDRCFSLIQTLDGGFGLAGKISPSERGEGDMGFVKTDSNGVVQWNRTYGGEEYDYCFSIIQTADGGFALAGGTESFGAGWRDMWLVKTDKNGNTQWNQTYGEIGFHEVNDLLQTQDGGFLLAGSSYMGMCLVKTDTNGIKQWNHSCIGTEWDWMTCEALIQTKDNDFALAGATGVYDIEQCDCVLVKTDLDGNVQWTQTYGGSDYDRCWDLIQTSDGGFALAGDTKSFGAGRYDIYLIKTNAKGVIQWNQTYGGAWDDRAHALLQTADGGFALAGVTESFPCGEAADMWLVKVDSKGAIQWNQTYGSVAEDLTFTFLQTEEGAFVLAGTIYGYSGSMDMGLVMTNPVSIETIEKKSSFPGILAIIIAIIVLSQLVYFSKKSQII
ncbi:MAG: hypothetical protein ACFFDT_16975 [Candidatus Hodarchaeota archaeon]